MTIMRFLTALSLIAASVAAQSTTTVTANTVITGRANFPAATSVLVNDNVLLGYDNGNGAIANYFYGDLTVLGELYIGDSGKHLGMSVYVYGDFTNSGTVVFNAQNETSEPSFYFQGSSNFLNDGTVIMVGIGNTGMTANVWNTGSVVNNGIAAYYQTVSRSKGTSFLGPSGSTVTNDGTVCLSQMNQYQYSKVQGTGCYNIGVNSLCFMNILQHILWLLRRPFSFKHQALRSVLDLSNPRTTLYFLVGVTVM